MILYTYMLRKIASLSCIAVSLFFATNYMAEAQANFLSSASSSKQAVILADVDMYSPSVTQAQDGSVSIIFILKAFDRNQAGIYYSISLTNNEGKRVYEYVFPRSVSLVKNELITVKDSFVPPVNLQGDFSAMIQVTNDTGLPLAFGSVDKVSIAAFSDKEFTSISSCVTEKKSIKIGESLEVLCEYTGTVTGKSKITSKLYRGNEKLSLDSQMLDLNESKGKINIPAQSAPGLYTVVLQSYEGSVPVGDTQTVRFIVEGFSAKIASVSPDKEQYVAGEQATVTAGITFYSTEKVKDIFAQAIIKNYKGEICALSAKAPVINSSSVILSIPVSALCDGFSLTVSLMYKDGTLLDTKTIETVPQEEFSFSSLFGDSYSLVRYIWYAVLSILLIALGVHFFYQKIRNYINHHL